MDGEQGNCGKRITCPYHAWTYSTDGRLVGLPLRANYPGLDPDQYGLAEIEQEIWRGFVFVRFAPGLPSVADDDGAVCGRSSRPRRSRTSCRSARRASRRAT